MTTETNPHNTPADWEAQNRREELLMVVWVEQKFPSGLLRTLKSFTIGDVRFPAEAHEFYFERRNDGGHWVGEGPVSYWVAAGRHCWEHADLPPGTVERRAGVCFTSPRPREFSLVRLLRHLVEATHAAGGLLYCHQCGWLDFDDLCDHIPRCPKCEQVVCGFNGVDYCECDPNQARKAETTGNPLDRLVSNTAGTKIAFGDSREAPAGATNSNAVGGR